MTRTPGRTCLAVLIVLCLAAPERLGWADEDEELAERARQLDVEGEAHYAAGRLEKATACFLEALPILRRVYEEDHPTLVAGVVDVAVCLYDLERYAEALTYWREALALRSRLHEPDHDAVARARNILGSCLYWLGRYREALYYYRENLAAWGRTRAPDDPLTVRARWSLAYCLDKLGRSEEAIPLLQENLQLVLRRHPEGDLEVARASLRVAQLLERLGREADALPYHERGLAVLRVHGADEPLQLAGALNGVACCFDDLGLHADALPMRREALTIRLRQHGGDHPDVVSAVNNLAYCLENLGRPKEALPLYRTSLAMSHRLEAGDSHDVALGAMNLAYCLARLGRPAEALPHAESAFAMSRRINGRIAEAAHVLATCLDRLGRGAEAIPLYEEALERVGQDAGHLGYVSAQALGTLLLDVPDRREEGLGLLDEAIVDIESMRARARVLGKADLAAYFRFLRRSGPYRAMVRAQVRLGRPSAALDYLERGRSRALLDLLERSQTDPVAQALARARARGDEVLRRRLESALEELDDAVRAVGKGTHAVAQAREARDVDPAARRELVAEQSAALARARARLETALQGRAALLRDVVDLARPATAGEVRTALEPGERMLVYSVGREDTLLFLVGPPGEPLTTTTLRWPDGTHVTVDGLTETVDAYLDALGLGGGAARSPLDKGGDDASRPGRRLGGDLFRALLPDAVWGEILGAPRVYIVPHGPLHRLPFEALVVEEDRTGEPRYVLDQGPPIGYAPSGSALLWCRHRRDEQRRHRQLLEVVALGDPIYGGGAVERPAWPASGALVLGVEAEGVGATAGLRVGDVVLAYDGEEVSDHRALRSLTRSVSDAIEDEERETGSVPLRVWRRGQELALDVPPGPLGLEIARSSPAEAAVTLDASGLPDTVLRGSAAAFYDSLSPLPGTRREVEAIARAFRGPAERRVVTLLGVEASEQNLFALAPRARYVHLGTHGLVDERDQASYSALALTLPPFATPEDDGFLTLLDLFENWRDRLSGCELAVLSACSTHRGPLHRDEGVFALSWGLHFAGCPSVIASLWNVSDNSTANLMRDFYARLAADRDADKLSTFTAARKAVRSAYPSPFHWAPFIYIGDPR